MGEKAVRPLLSVIVLSCNRLDLLWICLNSLFYHLETYPDFELIVLNHSATQEEGLFHLLKSVQGEYIMTVEDDWMFLPGGVQNKKDQWIQNSIEILEKYPDIKVVKLRQDDDGQSADGRDIRDLFNLKNIKVGTEIRCSNVGFNPFIMKMDFFKELMEGIKKSSEKTNVRVKFKKTWTEMQLKYNKLKVAKLHFKFKWHRRGVCIHSGYGRRLEKGGI